MNSEMYTWLLEDVLLTQLDEYPYKNYAFQQDNTAIHVSKHSKAWFSENNKVVMGWSSGKPMGHSWIQG